MTNKEAIDVLEDMKVKIAFPRSAKTQFARINEALEIAIKNLKTNDKIATNGDMIKAIFPYTKIRIYCTYVEIKLEKYYGQYDTGLLFDKGWWNAPYKRGE
jgi:ribosome maturation protein Sdo1